VLGFPGGSVFRVGLFSCEVSRCLVLLLLLWRSVGPGVFRVPLRRWWPASLGPFSLVVLPWSRAVLLGVTLSWCVLSSRWGFRFPVFPCLRSVVLGVRGSGGVRRLLWFAVLLVRGCSFAGGRVGFRPFRCVLVLLLVPGRASLLLCLPGRVVGRWGSWGVVGPSLRVRGLPSVSLFGSGFRSWCSRLGARFRAFLVGFRVFVLVGGLLALVRSLPGFCGLPGGERARSFLAGVGGAGLLFFVATYQIYS
jgi:hypothetical protein